MIMFGGQALCMKCKRLEFKGTCTTERLLEEGAPQGSALSCTLFLIYINYIADNMEVQTILIWSFELQGSISQRQHRGLSMLYIFCELLWKLKINTSKTVYTIFTLSPAPLSTYNCKVSPYKKTTTQSILVFV